MREKAGIIYNQGSYGKPPCGAGELPGRLSLLERGKLQERCAGGAQNGGTHMAATTIRCTTVRQMGRESAGTLIQGSMPESAGALLERFGGSVSFIR